MAMSSVSVVTNSLRLRSFTPPHGADEILHPSLRSRIADVSYLLAIGLVALTIGALSLFFFRPATAQMGQGMDTAPAKQSARVALATGGPVTPGAPTTLTFNLTDLADGRPVNAAPSHEADMHLVVVNKDLGHFAHIHPQAAGAVGQYSVQHTFPSAGEYILYDEFERQGTGDEVHRFEVAVGGGQSASAMLAADTAPKVVSGYTVSLATSGPVVAGETAGFVVTVERDGSPVADLEPYLGEAAHVIVLDESAGGFAHVHAVAGATPPGDAMDEAGEGTPARFGPGVAFSHRFPEAGLHKVWVQFSRQGEVVTVPWVVEVR
jgi:Cu+-exporting ATPase